MKNYKLSKPGRASKVRSDQKEIKAMVEDGWNVDGEILDNGTVSPVSFIGEEKPKKKAPAKKKPVAEKKVEDE